MRRAALLAATAALLPIAACGSPSKPAGPQPTVTVTAPPAASSSRRDAVNFDDLNKNEACFDLGTYRGAKRDGDPKTHAYAVDAQQAAGEVNDPEWSALVGMPAGKAMRRLAELCKEINYHG